MCTFEEFARYMQEQTKEIAAFRKQESLQVNRELTGEEAVTLWISQGHARRYRAAYEKERYGR